jgi:stage III sporulation protein SpoIIIAA
MLEQTTGATQSITDDLEKLLSILPPDLRSQLTQHPKKSNLIEVVLDLGRPPEARFLQEAEYLSSDVITREDLDYCIARVGHFSGDNRAGIERTLHRISAMRNRQGTIIGLTCRVGRAVFGTTLMIRDLVESGKSILLLGRPGVGKTTALREIARVLADELYKRVVIIDTSNEIAGDGDIPHPAIGRARRMQVARPDLQHQVMIEAVENHMPEVIVIDEIGTELEAIAARTIAERGVQLIGTAHGNRIENLMKNPTLSDLVGGIQSVTLGDDEARRRGTQKSILERKGRVPAPQERSVGEDGEVKVTQPKLPQPVGTELDSLSLAKSGWSGSGRIQPLPPLSPVSMDALNEDVRDFQTLLDDSFQQQDTFSESFELRAGPNGEDLPLHVYPYAVSRSQLEQVIQTLKLPIVLTKDIEHSDVIFALRSHVKGHTKLKQVARVKQVPIISIKSNSIPQIARGLRRLLNIDEPESAEVLDINLFTAGRNDSEMEALEEARLAVEQIVIPKGQPVELLPRSSQVRKMQHELIEHYRLHSQSFGEEPNRRLRIYPA